MSLSNPINPVIDVRGWFRAVTERRELLAMEDRMLRDIGLTRVDAQRIAHERRPFDFLAFPPPGTDSVSIDRAVIDAHVARAHRLRNDAIRSAFVALFRWLKPRPSPQPIARIRKLAPVAR
jgi:uncharacterized protein YjiS (DUF1127 family)